MALESVKRRDRAGVAMSEASELRSPTYRPISPVEHEKTFRCAVATKMTMSLEMPEPLKKSQLTAERSPRHYQIRLQYHEGISNFTDVIPIVM